MLIKVHITHLSIANIEMIEYQMLEHYIHFLVEQIYNFYELKEVKYWIVKYTFKAAKNSNKIRFIYKMHNGENCIRPRFL